MGRRQSVRRGLDMCFRGPRRICRLLIAPYNATHLTTAASDYTARTVGSCCRTVGLLLVLVAVFFFLRMHA